MCIILATAAVEAWETSRSRASAQWNTARDKARQAAQDRKHAAQNRMQAARRKGHRDLLWWPYQAGRLVAGAVAATGAAAKGAWDGGRSGARSGYQVGREGARKGWKLRYTWGEWRQRQQRTYTHPHEYSDQPPPRQYWTATVDRDPPPADPARGRVQLHAPPPRIGPPLPPRASTPGGDGPRFASHPPNRDEPRFVPPHDGFVHEGPHAVPDSIHITAEVVRDEGRSDAETPPVLEAEPLQIEGGNMSNQIVPATTVGTGEGLADTLDTLKTLVQQVRAVKESSDMLQENLDAQNIDHQTLTMLAEMADTADALSAQTEQAERHVDQRHSPVADAITGAGGSANVADTPFYDNH